VIASFINNYKKDQKEIMVIKKTDSSYTARISSSKVQLNIDLIDSIINYSVNNLFNDLNYGYINDESGGNGIYFTLEDTGIGFSHGIAFTKNSEILDGWGTEITLQEKIQGDWYYFETD
jgi:hypothetical protein